MLLCTTIASSMSPSPSSNFSDKLFMAAITRIYKEESSCASTIIPSTCWRSFKNSYVALAPSLSASSSKIFRCTRKMNHLSRSAGSRCPRACSTACEIWGFSK